MIERESREISELDRTVILQPFVSQDFTGPVFASGLAVRQLLGTQRTCRESQLIVRFQREADMLRPRVVY